MYVIYGTYNCGYCSHAKSLLMERGLDYKYVDLTEIEECDQESLMKIAGVRFRTVPQIFTQEESKMVYVGGFNELRESLNG